VFNPNVPFPQPIIFFDSYASTTTVISQEISRSRPAGATAPGMRYPANLVVEAFPTSPGTATVQVMDAPGPGSLTNTTDSNGSRSSITAYTKFMVKGVLERVAIKLTVQSGAWSVWGTFVEQPSDRAPDYDRNPVARANSYSTAGVGPHSGAVRWSYTVPSGKKTRVANLVVKLIRDGASGTPGMAAAFINYTPNGGAAVSVLIGYQNSGAVNALDGQAVGSSMVLLPGDAISGQTSDASTGGSFTYLLTWTGTEFDA
jgi:hypothetical protein